MRVWMGGSSKSVVNKILGGSQWEICLINKSFRFQQKQKAVVSEKFA